MAVKDMANQRFGRLLVVERADNDKYGNAMWLCKCDCGKTVVVKGQSLRRGDTLSCGCYHEDEVACRFTKHGQSRTRLYHTWQYMKRRCYNPKHKHYSYYGGRGIVVCDEWLSSYENFMQWAISNGYSDDLTLDRIDSDGNYEPNNCRWVSRKVQQNNRSGVLYFTINGETRSLMQWCEIYNVPHERTRNRVVNKGWNIIDALTTPPLKRNHQPR